MVKSGRLLQRIGGRRKDPELDKAEEARKAAAAAAVVEAARLAAEAASRAEEQRLAAAAAAAAEATRLAAVAAAAAAKKTEGDLVTTACDCCGSTALDPVDPLAPLALNGKRRRTATRHWGGWVASDEVAEHGEEGGGGGSALARRLRGAAMRTIKFCPGCAALQQQLTDEQWELDTHLRVDQTLLRERQAVASAGAGGGSGKAADYQVLVLGPLQGRHGAAAALDAANMLALDGRAEGEGLYPMEQLPQLTSLYHAADPTRPSTRQRAAAASLPPTSPALSSIVATADGDDDAWLARGWLDAGGTPPSAAAAPMMVDTTNGRRRKFGQTAQEVVRRHEIA